MSVLATSVDISGNALVLFTEDADRTRADIGEASLSLLVQSSTEARTALLPQSASNYPYIDRFSDDGVCLVGARSRWRSEHDFDLNAFLTDGGRRSANNLCFGDGNADVQVDQADRIWVSYFDEGVWGNFGWSGPGPKGLGAGGLNCFDRSGTLLWRHNGRHAGAFVFDCYALNVSAFGVWFYFYCAFKMGRVADDFSVEYFDTPVKGPRHFVTDGSRFVFSGEYGEPLTAFHATRHCGDKLVYSREVSLNLPVAKPNVTGRIARGDKLHVFADRTWFTYALDTLDFE